MSATEWDEGVLGTRGAEDERQQQEGQAAEGHGNQPRQATWRTASGPGPRVQLTCPHPVSSPFVKHLRPPGSCWWVPGRE